MDPDNKSMQGNNLLSEFIIDCTLVFKDVGLSTVIVYGVSSIYVSQLWPKVQN